MASKKTQALELTDQQRLKRLAKLREQLQAAVDEAGQHRRLLERGKKSAQNPLTEEESRPQPRRRGRRRRRARS